MILFKNTISKITRQRCLSLFMRLNFWAPKVWCRSSLPAKYYVNELAKQDFLTHTLTHTVKFPYGTSGTRRAKEDSDSWWKGLKMPIQHHLKGGGTFRNQQVARSSRITSSRKKRLPGLGAFFLSGVSDFAICAKPSLVGSFLLRF